MLTIKTIKEKNNQVLPFWTRLFCFKSNDFVIVLQRTFCYCKDNVKKSFANILN